MGLDKFMPSVTGHFHSAVEFERGLERIHPQQLAEKIFQQFYDEDGKLR